MIKYFIFCFISFLLMNACSTNDNKIIGLETTLITANRTLCYQQISYMNSVNNEFERLNAPHLKERLDSIHEPLHAKYLEIVEIVNKVLIHSSSKKYDSEILEDQLKKINSLKISYVDFAFKEMNVNLKFTGINKQSKIKELSILIKSLRFVEPLDYKSKTLNIDLLKSKIDTFLIYEKYMNLVFFANY